MILPTQFKNDVIHDNNCGFDYNFANFIFEIYFFNFLIIENTFLVMAIIKSKNVLDDTASLPCFYWNEPSSKLIFLIQLVPCKDPNFEFVGRA